MVKAKTKAVGRHFEAKLVNGSFGAAKLDESQSGSFADALSNPTKSSAALKRAWVIVGRCYVDASCIDCDRCRTTAPAFLTRDDEIGFSNVYRQPVTPEELALAEAAREGCPAESIANDGESA